MNGIIYCRVSSKEQVDGTSLASQEAACREYARVHHIPILRVFVEQGESAKFADRTQLLELIEYCRQNKGDVQALLVWKIDRFARNVADHFSVKATLKKYGVDVVSVTEPIDSNPEGKLLEGILASYAQFDNDVRAKRTVQGMEMKLQQGIFPWGPPLGYRSVHRSGEKKTEPDEPDQPLFGLLQKAWQEFATGAFTKAEIRRLMDAWGIRTRAGTPMPNQSLDQLFRNPYYSGILVCPWSGKEYEGKHIPMVDRETFARVQQVMAKRSRRIPHQKERPEFPLRGHVRCPSCLHYFTGSFSRGRRERYAYYHCNRPQCGARTSYATALVHSEFRSFLGSIAPKPHLVSKLGDFITAAAEKSLSFAEARQARRKSRLQQIERQTRELINMRTERLIGDTDFLAHKATLDEQRFALEGTSQDDRLDSRQVHRDLAEITDPLAHLQDTWEALPTPFRRRFHRLVLPVGFVHGKSRTAELGRLFNALSDLASGKTNGVPPVGESWNQIMQEITAFVELLRIARGGESPSG